MNAERSAFIRENPRLKTRKLLTLQPQEEYMFRV